jgi:O-antigen/teichoic acid export membrane protein
MTKTSPKRALIAGAAWAIAMRWSVRALGFCNTMIMARLLVPADYGVVAMAMLVVGLVQTLLDTGIATALLRKGELTRDEIDSAWTLRLLEFIAVGLLIAAVSYPASLYFQEPKVIAVLLVMSACIGIQGLTSIGFILAHKELNFSVEFRTGIVCKLIGVAFTILGGVIFGDYRALILGIASSYLSSTVLSYTAHPYRACWNLSRVADIWHVTKWLMFAGIASFTLRRGDELIAARIGGAQQFGLYNVSSDLGQMPTGEVGPALLKAFLPVLSTIQHDAHRTNQAVLKTIAAVNTLTIPIGVIMAVLAAPLTLLLLGSTWNGAAPLVGIFALIGTLQILVSPLGTLLILRGYTRLQSTIIWLEFAAFLASAACLVPLFGIIGLAYARMCSTATQVGLTTFHARRLCELTYGEIWRALYRPMLGSGLAATVGWVSMQRFGSPFIGVALAGSLSVASYSVWCLVSWHLAGRPEGLESTIVDRWRDSRLKGISRGQQ